jgi:hypothetical protein
LRTASPKSNQTGEKKMSAEPQETSLGGLAVNLPEC